MPRFRFELEALLRSRRLAEQARQREVASIERERSILEDTLRRQQRAIEEGKASLTDALVGTIDAESLRLHAAATMQQLRQGQRIVLELAGVHRRLDSARIALIEAARRRRAVELLRQQRLEQWQAAQDKAETDAIDELAVIRAAQIEPVFRAENHG
jgi:flagellar FliJ protein